jgi:predicted dehydrogenase
MKSFKVGILGFGDRGESLVAPIMDYSTQTHITTIIDPDVQRSKFYFQDCCVSKGVVSLEEADNVRFIKDIDELKVGELDLLFLTANEKVRTMLFERAVGTGSHIFTDKALSNDLEGCKTIVNAMRGLKKGQRVFMGFNMRYHPQTMAVKQILNEGRLGRVLFIQYLEALRFEHGSSFYRRFYRDVENSGGLLITKACHDFDLMGYFVESRPSRVFCTQDKMMFGKGGSEAREFCQNCDRTHECDFAPLKRESSRARKSRYEKVWVGENRVTSDGYMRDVCVWREDTELRDLSTTLIEYENGVRATYSQVLFSPYGQRSIKIFCENGCIEMNEGSDITVIDRWDTRRDRIVAKTDGKHGKADENMINNLFGTLENVGAPLACVEDGVWSVAIGTAAYESVANGKWVAVRPLAERVIQ